MFPYQIVACLVPPKLNEFIYHGERGWLPQVAIKRRFSYQGSEEALIAAVRDLHINPFELRFRKAGRPEHMPVEVIEIEPTRELLDAHRRLYELPGIVSKFPEREGESYFPHMTVEWEGEQVVEPSKYEDTTHLIRQIWLVKDDGDDSRAVHEFGLYGGMEKIFNDNGEVVKAGCVVFDQSGRLLLIKDPAQPKWSLPKGHVEPGENLESAAARETEEETGLAIKVVKSLGNFHYNGSGSPSRLHLWLAQATGHQGKAEEHWEWVQPKQATERLWPEVVEFLKQNKLI